MDHTYGGEGIDNGWGILELEDGGFLIVGFTDSFGAGGMDIYLFRTDMEGELLWDRTFGGPKDEFGWAMAAAPNGGLCAGRSDQQLWRRGRGWVFRQSKCPGGRNLEPDLWGSA